MARKSAADPKDARSSVIKAALALAAEQDWSKVGMAEIADKADLDLSELRRTFASKPQIIAAFMRMIDDEVLAKAPKRAEGQPGRDAVFEVIMSRFDALAPHKAALRSISATAPFDPQILRAGFASQAWMLHAAGTASDGPLGTVKVVGLANVYAQVFRIWLDDDDPSHARTMAALDVRLRRGERGLATIEEFCAGVERMRRSLCGAVRRTSSGGEGGKPSSESTSPAA